MYFNKIPHPENFDFTPISKNFLHKENLGKVVSIGFTEKESSQWPSWKLNKLNLESSMSKDWDIQATPSQFYISYKEEVLLQGHPQGWLGRSADRWIFNFQYDPNYLFFGMGEKNQGFEKTGSRTLFWNTDVLADFSLKEVEFGSTDPMYLNIPYLIINKGNLYFGLLINNSQDCFMATGSGGFIMEQGSGTDKHFYIGANGYPCEVLIIPGPALPEVTRILQNLCGKTPLPPVWSLGYHQCRWGYQSFNDLDALDKEFFKRKIPCSALWLDIDYMNGFRVFTYNRENFPNPEKQIKEIQSRGRKVIPIIDPGVKVEESFAVYRRGLETDAFCHNEIGTPFKGVVWPGITVFPDFSLMQTQEWWQKEVEKFLENGVEGAWLDMNDPSTGSSALEQMRFNRGRLPHRSYHNLYALGMQQATKKAFKKVHKNKRTFLLSRSGTATTSQYSAIWTGDNVSNYHHLRKSIEISLNLGLSGIPFNGPDVPGFARDAWPQLAVDWYKAAFLFPFFRNHSVVGSRRQEPWAFGKKTENILTRYIKLRYKLLPYLYNLFIQQEQEGEAILAPMFYHCKIPKNHKTRSDQFFTGPHILQAPFTEEKQKKRKLYLPEGKWYSWSEGIWRDGNQETEIMHNYLYTPLFTPSEAIIPTLTEIPNRGDLDLTRQEIIIFTTGDGSKASGKIYSDDGSSFDYQKGKKTELFIEAIPSEKDLLINIQTRCQGFGEIQLSFITLYPFKKLIVQRGEKKTVMKLKKQRFLAGPGICYRGIPEDETKSL